MPASNDGRRKKRVAELIQRHFSDVLLRELDDPKLASVVVTAVEVTDDLSIATIRIRLLVAEDDPKARRTVVERLRRAAPRLRRAIAPRVDLKRAPDLRFHYDDGQDAHQRIQELLREVASDPKSD